MKTHEIFQPNAWNVVSAYAVLHIKTWNWFPSKLMWCLICLRHIYEDIMHFAYVLMFSTNIVSIVKTSKDPDCTFSLAVRAWATFFLCTYKHREFCCFFCKHYNDRLMMSLEEKPD